MYRSSAVVMVAITMVILAPCGLESGVVRRSVTESPDDVDLGGFFVNFFQGVDLRDHCTVSEWSAWSAPASMTQCSEVMRTRTVTRSADFCPPLTETKTECPTYLSAAEAFNTGFFGSVMNVALGTAGPQGSADRLTDGMSQAAGARPGMRPLDFEFESESEYAAVSPTAIDVLYIIDKSGSVSEDFFRMALNDVKRLVEIFPLPISPTDSRVALMTFSSEDRINIEFDFEQNTGVTQIMGAIDEIQYEGGTTCTAPALRMALTDLFERPGARPTLHKYLFLFTDGHSNCGGDAVEAAAEVKNAHVEIFAVGITDNINEGELQQIVSTPVRDHFYFVESFVALSGMVDVLKAFDSMGRLGMSPDSGQEGEQFIVSGPNSNDNVGTGIQFDSWIHQDVLNEDPGPLGAGSFVWGRLGQPQGAMAQVQ